jgi:ABC-2 type transport system permease protein
MPVAVQIFTYFIPARYFLVALRSIILKGVGLRGFWSDVLFLFLFGILMLSLSWVRMRKKKL